MAALVRPADKTDHVEWDTDLPGFGVRLRGQSKRWVIQYRIGAQQRRESLGDVPRVRLEEARKIARSRFAQVELGHDPAAERAKVRQAAASTKLTLGIVAARYLSAKQDRLRPSTYKQAKWHFETLWAPLGNQPIDTLKRATLRQDCRRLPRHTAARQRHERAATCRHCLRGL